MDHLNPRQRRAIAAAQGVVERNQRTLTRIQRDLMPIERVIQQNQRGLMAMQRVFERNQRGLMAVQRVVERNQRAIDGAFAAYRVALPVLPLLELPFNTRARPARRGQLPEWVAQAPEPVFRAWLEGNL